MDVQAALAEEADLDRYVTAIQRGFETHPFAAEILPVLTRDFYRWKFWTPAGRSLVASARQGDNVVALVAASPVRIASASGILRGWQVGEIATVPAFRGRGLFRQSLETLCRQIPDGEPMFCFPNDAALPALSLQGFRQISELACHAKPILPLPITNRQDSKCHAIEHFDFDAPPESGDHLTVLRDGKYLEWRYRRCPTRRYDAACCGSPSDPDGVVVVRRYRAHGVDIALIMDMQAKNAQTTAALLAWATRWARQQRLSILMTMADPPPAALWRQGFVRLPAAILPKRQICVARVNGAKAHDVSTQPGRWHLQVGDWDGL